MAADEGIHKGDTPKDREKYTLEDSTVPGAQPVLDIPAPGTDLEEAQEVTQDDHSRPDPGIEKARAMDTDYQRAGQVRQLLNERRNAVAYENEHRVNAIDKQLRGHGYEGDLEAEVDKRSEPRGRQTREQKTTKADAPTGQGRTELSPGVSKPDITKRS